MLLVGVVCVLHVCVCVHMHVCMHVCVCVCVCVCVYLVSLLLQSRHPVYSLLSSEMFFWWYNDNATCT